MASTPKTNPVFGAQLVGGVLVPDVAPVSSGPAGAAGWSPVFGGELDGVRTLLRVVDWTGGGGTKPAVGVYVGPSGYVSAKANAFNFNATKRVMVVSQATNAQGVATFDFTPYGFANPPGAIALPATTGLLSGATRSTIGPVTKLAATVTVQQQAVLTGIVSVLAGATANLLIIEV